MGQLDCNDKAVESIYTISKEYFVTCKKNSKYCTGLKRTENSNIRSIQ